MADQVLVQSCLVADFDAATGTCSAPFYSLPEGMVPTLSMADGQEIGMAIALLWGAAFGIRMMKRVLQETG
jgi:hypothetical protein